MISTDAVNVAFKTESSITLSSDEYVHVVEFEGEFIFDDNYFSLLPGEKRTVTFRPCFKSDSNDLKVTGYTIE